MVGTIISKSFHCDAFSSNPTVTGLISDFGLSVFEDFYAIHNLSGDTSYRGTVYVKTLDG